MKLSKKALLIANKFADVSEKDEQEYVNIKNTKKELSLKKVSKKPKKLSKRLKKKMIKSFTRENIAIIALLVSSVALLATSILPYLL